MVTTISLKGKLVLVSGAGRGIGISVARSIAEGEFLSPRNSCSRADFAALTPVRSRRRPSFDMRVEFRDSVIMAFKMPAGNSSVIDAAVKNITEEMGEIDIVVANAGVCHHVDAEKTTDAQLEDTFQVNLFAPFYLSRSGVDSPFLAGKSSQNTEELITCSIVFSTWFPTPETPAKSKVILFVSSISAHIYNTPQNQVVYNSSKAGLTMLGKSLAGEWAPRGVRVNMISPGYIDTDMSTGSAGGKRWSDEWMRRTPIGRFGTPKEVADMLVVMASDMATFMTGTDMVLDGGCE
ncbi:hypothetical protein P7C70_g23, partial [Phenoliferia sp. Uapishka_3]